MKSKDIIKLIANHEAALKKLGADLNVFSTDLPSTKQSKAGCDRGCYNCDCLPTIPQPNLAVSDYTADDWAQSNPLDLTLDLGTGELS
jgi:hypothetical protein